MRCDRRIVDVRRGEVVTVTGRARSVRYGAAGTTLETIAELVDPTGAVDVCWMGRRAVPGVDAGRRLRVTARVGVRDGQMIMFNPYYELLGEQPSRNPEGSRARI